MLDEHIKRYQSLDVESRKVINILALANDALTKEEIIQASSLAQERIDKILEQETASQIIVMNKITYYNEYTTNTQMTIWLFPLICDRNTIFYDKKNRYINYVSPNCHRYLLKFLYALCYRADQLKIVDKELISYAYGRTMISQLTVLFSHSAYEVHIPKIPDTICGMIYSDVLAKIKTNLDTFSHLEMIDNKMRYNKSSPLSNRRAEVAIIQGDFERARDHTAPYREEAINSFLDAIFAFQKNEIEKTLMLFERGMKKQRRIYRQKYLPIQPEIAIFYLSAYLSKNREYYTPIFLKVVKEKGETPSYLYYFFTQVCKCCIEDTEMAAKIAANVRNLIDNPPEQILWRTIAIGLMGETYETEQDAIFNSAEKAFNNKHYVIAYEAAYLLAQWVPTNKHQQLFNKISEKLNYRPALSHIKHTEEWERELSSYLSLEAIQMVMHKTDNNKSRIAYRFFPNGFYALPVVQSYTAGIWTAGRSIAINNFIGNRVEYMTAQDKRIAAAANYHSLGRASIAEMVGHPYVYLENSNMLVEFVASQPVISAVKLPDNMCRLECDIENPSEGFIVQKETNIRYRVYNLTKFQCDIIKAISKSKPVPEAGRERMMQILKYFSMYMQVQSDLVVGENDDLVRQVEPDSRIRVQLLPMGDGLKAELFAKPFGTHPPYCKPGQGGRSLIAIDDGERVRVTRNIDDETTFNEQLLNDIKMIEHGGNNNASAGNGLMVFGNPLDALELLDVLDRHRDISVAEWPEGERLKIRKKVASKDISLRLKSNTNWFELDGELKVDEDTILTLGRLLEMVRSSHGRFIELSSGEFLALSEQLRRRLVELAEVTPESKNEVILNRFASVSIMDAFDEFEDFSVDKAWHNFRKRLQSVQVSNAPVPPLLQTDLRPYQLSGYQWMIRLSEWGAGACLADDMGLGKTVQAIAVLLHRADVGASIVVAPVSVMPNWISEINRFAPSLNVKTLRNDRETMFASLEPGDVLVTSYGLLLSEEQAITAIHWTTVILDEAHAIKNYNTKTSKAAMSLQADFRVILTGTPIQNHLGEIWNLFQFINPGLLGSLQYFNDAFIRIDNEKSRARLKKLITPFILRRTKTAVLEELPPKTEIVRKITLSEEELVFYETIRRQALESLERDNNSTQGTKHLKILAEITRLRQACCSPSLVNPGVTIESTKLATFLEIASELKESGHRALVFSQFVTHLSIVRRALDKAGYKYCYLDGSTMMTRREMEVRRFQNGQVDFFLISLKAGGLGLNLTAADYVIHLDPWWNPAIEDQASDRAHRIGQERPVTVYRLVAEQTIEEKIIKLHNTKRDLADSLLEGSDQSAKMSIDELIALIKE
jgi:superfamily II DNA or RNA helicase